MRTLRFFALVGIFLANGIFVLQLRAKTTHQISALQPSNYVVIGAFAIENNAVRFTAYAKKKALNAHFEINPNRNLYYVYVLDTDDRQRAVIEAIRLREETEFVDAWVFGGMLGTEEKGEDIQPVTQEPIEQITTADQNITTEETDQSMMAVNSPQPKEEAEDNINGKKFLFSPYRSVDGAEVEGDVDVIDTDRSLKLATYKAHEPVRVPAPNGNSGEISFICDVFGYRKVQRDLNYESPEGEGITKDDEGDIVVPFELVRLQKGDIAVMYNVYFYKDAAIMRPESRYEVNSLLEMLKENPNYKIKLHGHTNGNAAGKIISMGENKNFFSLSDTKEGFGTAKKLSEERAEIIRDYLINEGIDPKRMEVKAWGGKRPIYDKTSARAQENVRVEVEILED